MPGQPVENDPLPTLGAKIAAVQYRDAPALIATPVTALIETKQLMTQAGVGRVPRRGKIGTRQTADLLASAVRYIFDAAQGVPAQLIASGANDVSQVAESEPLW